mmetsp:Transcript_9245/g.22707  ORF Transcript_9245/g.22707 Transcript_9245/m.22707 type:complete len:233 (+) Transcript_9245:478-1176(+)
MISGYSKTKVAVLELPSLASASFTSGIAVSFFPPFRNCITAFGGLTGASSPSGGPMPDTSGFAETRSVGAATAAGRGEVMVGAGWPGRRLEAPRLPPSRCLLMLLLGDSRGTRPATSAGSPLSPWGDGLDGDCARTHGMARKKPTGVTPRSARDVPAPPLLRIPNSSALPLCRPIPTPAWGPRCCRTPAREDAGARLAAAKERRRRATRRTVLGPRWQTILFWKTGGEGGRT